MFGLFQPTSPVSPWEKAWTEDRLLWISGHFGLDRALHTDVLLPQDDQIPPANSYEEANQLLQFLREWTKLSFVPIRLEVLGDDVLAIDSIGIYNDQQPSAVVRVQQDHFAQPRLLIATMAWQLAAIVIASGQLRNVRQSDLAWTTELLTVYLGFGLFTANHTLREPKPDASHFAWWGVRQRAYLPGRIFGYAMASQAYMHGLDISPWSRGLRQDAAAALADSLKYLRKTDDTCFHPNLPLVEPTQVAPPDLQMTLRRGTPSMQIAALWELSRRIDRGEIVDAAAFADLVIACLRHKHAEVRATAAGTLPLCCLTAEGAMNLCDALKDSSDDVRTAAASSLAAFPGVDDETVVHDLTAALHDDSRLVVFNAANSLVRFGPAAQTATTTLLKRLRNALVDCRDGDAQAILQAIDSICDDTQSLLRQSFGEMDVEYLDYALELHADLSL